MKSRVQRNFKRQMKLLQKQIKSKPGEKVFSYIEKDYIDSYYAPKKKARAINIGILRALGILLMVYSTYLWANSLLGSSNISGSTLKPAVVKRSSSKSNENQIAVFNYLNEITPYIEEINTYIQKVNFNFNGRAKNNRQTLYNDIGTGIVKTDQIIASVQGIQPPSEMTEYHKILTKRIYAAYGYSAECKIFLEGKSSNGISQQIGILNATQCDLTAELLKVFDKLQIQYTKEKNSIKFKINR